MVGHLSGNSLQQLQTELIDLAHLNGLDLIEQIPQVVDGALHGQERQSLQNGHLVCLMLLGRTVPDDVKLLGAYPALLVHECQ